MRRWRRRPSTKAGWYWLVIEDVDQVPRLVRYAAEDLPNLSGEGAWWMPAELPPMPLKAQRVKS